MSFPSKPILWASILFLCTIPAPCAAAAEIESDEVYTFTCGDFSPEPEVLSGIFITGLPEHGIIQLGERIIRAGDILTADQLERLTYAPGSTQQDLTAQMRYLPVFSQGLAQEAVVTISILGKQDEPPIAEDLTVETYKNLPSEGMLPASDPEEQQLCFTVIRQPRRGSVIIREDGSYLYTPEKNKVGTDSFTYTVADPAGNVSREATVTIRILKPSDDLQYADTAGLSCRFAAEWLRQTGIFSGETVSGQLCFSPEKPITQGQFLVMLMDALGLPADHSAANTGLVEEAPVWLRPYLAAALRSGLITTALEPEQPITVAEAESMTRNMLEFALPAALTDEGAITVWCPDEADLLTRGEAAELLYQLSQEKTRLPTLSVLFTR